MTQCPIVGTITVTHETTHGILAKIDGRTILFPNRDTLFRAAVELLDARTRDRQKKGPCHGTATAPPG